MFFKYPSTFDLSPPPRLPFSNGLPSLLVIGPLTIREGKVFALATIYMAGMKLMIF